MVQVFVNENEEVYLTDHTLSEYLALKATIMTSGSFLVDLIFRVSSLKAFVVSTAATALIETIRHVDEALAKDLVGTPDSANFFTYNAIQSAAVSAMDIGVDILWDYKAWVKDLIGPGIIRYVLDNFVIGSFDDAEVFDFITATINEYPESLIKGKSAAAGNENALREIARAEPYAASIKHLENSWNEAITVDEKKQRLGGGYQEFVEDYMTTDDFYSGLYDNLLKEISNVQRAEYDYWVYKTDTYGAFDDQYRDKILWSNTEKGRYGGHMDSFRQTYSSAMWFVMKEGTSWAGEKWKELKLDEWEGDATARNMDIWNSHIGSVIGRRVIEEAHAMFPEEKERESEAYKQWVGRRIQELTASAIDKGIVAESQNDLRLNILDDGEWHAWDIQRNAQEIIDATRAGLATEGGRQLIDFILDTGSAPAEVDRAAMLDRIITNPLSLYRHITENNVSKPGLDTSKMAHEWLQLVQWSALGGQRQGNGLACDPNKEDEFDLTLRNKYSFADMGGRIDCGPVQGRVFTDGERHYLVFNDIPTGLDGVFKDVCQNRDIYGFAYYLNIAYQAYAEVVEQYNLEPDKTVLLGHDDGGTLASALAAALYMGAFNEQGQFDPLLALYGWSLDEEGNVIDNIPAQTVNTLTFGAAPVGWFFQKQALIEEAPCAANGYRAVYRFGYSREYLEYMEKIKDAPVYSVGFIGEDPEYAVGWENYDDIGSGNANGRWEFRIGRDVPLFDTDGQLKYYPKEAIEKWDALDTFELALHEHDRRYGGDPGRDDYNRGGDSKVDPLIIDLNRDGVVSTSSVMRYFDLDGDGFIEQTAWAASGDGVLVLDRDGDGRITSGRELFGDRTVLADGRVAKSGFEALAELDSNGDGLIDANDELFSALRIWADRDGDGVFGDDELFTLEELGIVSIDLGYRDTPGTDENGNDILRSASVTWDDGAVSKVSEFLLNRDLTATLPDVSLPVPNDILALPEIDGRGGLYSFHQAMVRDESGRMKALLEQFIAEENPAARKALCEQILMKWAGVEDVPESGRGYFNARKLAFLEKYFGTPFTGHFNDGLAHLEAPLFLQRSYDAVTNYLYGQLLAQTHYEKALSSLSAMPVLNEEGKVIGHYYSINAALAGIAETYAVDSARAKQQMIEFFLALKESGLIRALDERGVAAAVNDLAGCHAELVDLFHAARTLAILPYEAYGTLATPAKIGSAAGETINGTGGNDVLIGLNGDDVINGGGGGDTIVGGQGDDILSGGAGSDTYIWNLGDGNDVILDKTDYFYSTQQDNILILGAGVSPDNARLEKDGNDLVLIIGESGERITLRTGTASYRDYFARIEFADGTCWDREYLRYRALTQFVGTDGDDNISGTFNSDEITGGLGDDYLSGGRGDDIYLWNPGDGNDIINDTQGANTIKIGAAVDPAAVELVSFNGYDLIMIFPNGERLTFVSWFGYGNDQSTQVHFADGTRWTWEEVSTKAVIAGTEGNDKIDGPSMIGTGIYGYEGDDELRGGARDDVLIGGRGNDYLAGGGGDDVYIWNLGDGNDTILDFQGANVLRFGEGIFPDDVSFSKSSNDDLYIEISPSGEKIDVSRWFDGKEFQLSEIQFADGTVRSTMMCDSRRV